MPRRFSSSQLKSKLRQAQQKQRQAVNKYNAAVRKHNQNVRTAANKYNSAINRYNQEVRAHNSRVRANRARLKSLLAQLNRTPATTQFVVYRQSVQNLSVAYTRFEQRSDTHQIGPEYNRYVDLAERETANSVEVANRIFGDVPIENEFDESGESLQHAKLGDRLRIISTDLDDRWKGAVYSLHPNNPDAARHFCTSTRELFVELLEISAPDDAVFASLPDATRTDRGNATRKSKIRYLLHRQGMADDSLEEFVEANMEDVVQLFHVLSKGTHGSAGTFAPAHLASIKKRVEDGITFLTEIIGIA